MMKLLLPLVLAVLGVAGGVGAGLALKPAAHEDVRDNPCGEIETTKAEKDGHTGKEDDHGEATEGEHDYIKLNNQFVVPVVNGDLVDSLVVMSLSVEIAPGQRETVYAREPKLRDALLQVLFDHANMGGFKGAFTNGNNLDMLRTALTETARTVLGKSVRSILIVDIARQDV